MARKLTDTVQLKLRFDEELRRRLERAAKKRDTSLNSEIIRRLEWSLQEDQTAQVEEALLAQMAKIPVEQIGGALVGLAALRSPKAREAAMAAFRTEQGRAAALDALRMTDEDRAAAVEAFLQSAKAK